MSIVSLRNRANNPRIELHGASVNGKCIIALLRWGRQCRMIDASGLDFLNFTSAERLRAWNQAKACCPASSNRDEVPA
jgi:hypothetical protein